jgi:hypothetical protein
MSEHRDFKFSEIISMSPPKGFDGSACYGFHIGDEYGAPLLAIIYETQDAATAARDVIMKAMKDVIAIVAPGR